MKKVLILAMLAWSGISCAETPQVLTNAVNAYHKSGYTAFVPTLVKGSAIEHEKQVLSLTAIFPAVEEYYGKLQNIEILREVKISSKAKNTFFVLNYENGPLFGLVTTYNGQGGEVVTHVLLNMAASQVLPSSLVKGDK
jgi:hypothetical protein